MTLSIPTGWAFLLALFFQALLLTFVFTFCLGELCKHQYRPRRAAAVLFAGTVAGVAVGLTTVLLRDNRVFVSHCRTSTKSELPDCILVIAGFFQGSGLFSAGGAGIVLAWLAARYWRRGIRADITTMIIGGALAGLAVGAVVEWAQIRWGNSGGVDPPRLSFFALLGAFLSLASRPFLFRKGRFQFGIKNMLAYTVVWALVFGWLGPQFARYRAESTTLASLARVLGAPVQCERLEGLTGLAYVHAVYLPRCTIADTQIDAVAGHLKRLSRLWSVDITSATLSKEGLQRLKGAVPGVHFGGYSSGRSDYKEKVLPTADPPKDHTTPEKSTIENPSPR